MNHLTTAITTFSTASAIVLGGILFAPTPISPAGPPTTAVPVELQDRSGSPLKDGEVTTTSYRVDYRNGVAYAGSSVSTSTKATFTANLPNGEYLIKTVVGANTGLWPIQDIDATFPVPTGSGCVNLYDCTWIVVSNNTWNLRDAHGQPHAVALFNFDRPPPVPKTSGVQVPTTQPSRVSPPGPPATIAPAAAASNAQTVTFWVRDETNGVDNTTPIEGAMTVVTYLNPDNNVPYVISARTGADGKVSHTFPRYPYIVNVTLPAGYEPSSTPDLGPYKAGTTDQSFDLQFGGKRSTPVTTEPRGQLDETPKPKIAIPAAAAAPAAPVVTTPPAAEQTPVTATPAPVVTRPVPVTTEPETVVTVPETVPAPEPETRLGCDESDDPEIQALLWTNDGAIRWMEDGEMITLYPEAGMDPVEVCVDAYHRLTELGLDIDFYTVK